MILNFKILFYCRKRLWKATLSGKFYSEFRRIKQDFKRRYSLAYIKETFRFFGHDVSSMTDDELEQGIVQASLVGSQLGITVEEFKNISKRMSALVNS